jgi:hypothetical protein
MSPRQGLCKPLSSFLKSFVGEFGASGNWPIHVIWKTYRIIEETHFDYGKLAQHHMERRTSQREEGHFLLEVVIHAFWKWIGHFPAKSNALQTAAFSIRLPG